MSDSDFFRPRLDAMIDLKHPLAVLAQRPPWAQIEAALAPAFARRERVGRRIERDDLFGCTLQVAGAGVSAAGRPRLSMRLMASLLYLKHAFNLSDKELVQRWSENVQFQFFSGQLTTLREVARLQRSGALRLRSSRIRRSQTSLCLYLVPILGGSDWRNRES